MLINAKTRPEDFQAYFDTMVVKNPAMFWWCSSTSWPDARAYLTESSFCYVSEDTHERILGFFHSCYSGTGTGVLGLSVLTTDPRSKMTFTKDAYAYFDKLHAIAGRVYGYINADNPHLVTMDKFFRTLDRWDYSLESSGLVAKLLDNSKHLRLIVKLTNKRWGKDEEDKR